MRLPKTGLLVLLTTICVLSCGEEGAHHQKRIEFSDMMIRIAEIEVDSVYIEEYSLILQEEAAASVELEEGVWCMYPMFQKENPTEIRILEIYANKDAYESHLETPHFKHYKSTTLNMVKSLKLIEMEAIDQATMTHIFKKFDQKLQD